MRLKLLKARNDDEADDYESRNQHNCSHPDQGEKYFDCQCVLTVVRVGIRGLESDPSGHIAQVSGTLIGKDFGISGHG